MKHNIVSLRPVGFGLLTLLTLVWIAAIQKAAGQNTAFTYQGRLNAGGSPANGVYDFTFQAFDAVVGGASIGGTVNVNGVGVTNGLFTALVDLGSTPFTGPARWLQISVSTNGAGGFTILTPRQPLTPSPYAIYANTSGTVTNGAIANAQLAANAVAAGNIQNNTITAGKIASGQVVKSLNGLTDAVSLTQGANVTINTVGNSLQISAPAGGLNLPYSGSAASTGSVFAVANSGTGPAATFLSRVGIGTTSPDSDKPLTIQAPVGQHAMTWHNSSFTLGVLGLSGDNNSGLLTLGRDGVNKVILRANGNSSFTGGNLGVGTAAPLAELDVRGDIRLGQTGQFRAVSGEENLRIVRGRVGYSGNILAGSGFGVTIISEGVVLISFTTPFTGSPVITANVEENPAFSSFAQIEAVTSGTAQLQTIRRSDGNHVSSIFHFIAIGPR